MNFCLIYEITKRRKWSFIDYIFFKIWDTAGQERFQSLTNIFYKGNELHSFFCL